MLVVFSLGLLILHYWGKIVLCTLPNVLWVMRSSTLACNIPGLCEFWAQLIPLVVLFLAQVFSSHSWCWLSLRWMLLWDPLLFSRVLSLCTVLSPLELCPSKARFLGHPGLSAQLRTSTVFFPDPPSCAAAWKPSWGSKLGQ